MDSMRMVQFVVITRVYIELCSPLQIAITSNL